MKSVLISTYWNVNLNNTVTNEHIYIVLISTYWNVNASEGTLSGVDNSFNLNLLECKY